MQPIRQTNLNHQPHLVRVLAAYSICACVISATSVLIADFVVPDHDWMADTISDLGAGKFEFIVDIGIYAVSSALIAISLLAAHVHLGGWRWSVGVIGLAVLGLIVFLIGARNEYGDNDNEGVVIHIYLVYALGILMAVIPAVMANGAARVGSDFGRWLVAISVLWCLSAPIFFFLPTEIDGVYERYLGLITFALIGTLARLFFLFSKKMQSVEISTGIFWITMVARHLIGQRLDRRPRLVVGYTFQHLGHREKKDHSAASPAAPMDKAPMAAIVINISMVKDTLEHDGKRAGGDGSDAHQTGRDEGPVGNFD